ncbi:MAG: hypothetical protein ILA29_06400 [Prevotella sp.]|nr:hypothetical protein [Prevotella sp.]
MKSKILSFRVSICEVNAIWAHGKIKQEIFFPVPEKSCFPPLPMLIPYVVRQAYAPGCGRHSVPPDRVHGPCTLSTRAMYSEYTSHVLSVQGPCTAAGNTPWRRRAAQQWRQGSLSELFGYGGEVFTAQRRAGHLCMVLDAENNKKGLKGFILEENM